MTEPGAGASNLSLTGMMSDVRDLADRLGYVSAEHVDLEGKDPKTGKVVRTPVRLVDCNGLDLQDEDAFRWRFVIAVEVARSERQRIKARNLATCGRLKAAGRWTGGAAPYGGRVVEDSEVGGKVLTTADDEAELLRAVGARLIGGVERCLLPLACHVLPSARLDPMSSHRRPLRPSTRD